MASHYVTTRKLETVSGRVVHAAVLVRCSGRGSITPWLPGRDKPKFTVMVSFPAFLTNGKLPSHAEALAYLNRAKPF